MKIVMSIKPEFANRIFSGEKEYEYRKKPFRKNISSVLVYASAPVKMVIGEFSVKQIMTDNPEIIWEKTRTKSGITYDYFRQYFKDSSQATAIQVEKAVRFNRLQQLSDFGIKRPPQSFCYLCYLGDDE
ncbi:MAG: ASCH domain-containing protein [Succinivibrio dextrinosolvens]|nr:ASCH domain-containing protein [Succinivibrio dextrinosolvens]MDY6471038.1 ASCH domain-containing protein [Succinivibrio dextrinosolvens]